MFLLAVTLAVFGIRAVLRQSSSTPQITHPVVTARYYRVRPGDTLAAVAAKTGVSAAGLRRLNPKLQTALFIGERIRLR